MKPDDFKPNHRILIIDDNPSIHDDFRKILAPPRQEDVRLRGLEVTLFEDPLPAPDALSFELDSAFQGQEGLEKVKKSLAENRPYALAFVDVRMPPGWDGVETISRIWEVFPELQIVVCTAYSDYSWEELRLQVGQPDNLLVLKKPFDNVEVRQLAHALTKKWLLNVQANYKLAELEVMVERRTADLSRTNTLLAATEERLNKAFHSSPIPSAIKSLEDRLFVDVNEPFARLIGCTTAQLIGHPSGDLLRWEQPDMVETWFDRVARNEEVREEAARLRSQSGIVRDVLVSLIPMSLGGRPHLLMLAQDVSERLMLERQLLQSQKMESIGQLAAGVAHDFNNILTVIQGHAGLIQMHARPDDPAGKSISQVLVAATRAATLIRQLLMFSRKQVTQFRDIDLNETLGNSLAMTGRLTGEHVELDFRPTPDLPAIKADDSMVEQIVMNLTVNARDAMPNGGKIRIATGLAEVDRPATKWDAEPRQGRFVCLKFTDTGCGMDEKILARIFEPFFTTKAPGKGTGLGLATVQSIIRQHHGWLEVESQPGVGTTFLLYFPVSVKPAEKNAPTDDNLLPRGTETIMVVEDEAPLREMLSLALVMQGYKVHDARSGRHALEVWENVGQDVDLLVTDMIMPEGVLGAELAQRLVARKPGLKVIFTSGYTPDMAGKDVSLMEGHNFMPKPYTIGKMAQLVRQCLDRKKESIPAPPRPPRPV